MDAELARSAKRNAKKREVQLRCSAAASERVSRPSLRSDGPHTTGLDLDNAQVTREKANNHTQRYDLNNLILFSNSIKGMNR